MYVGCVGTWRLPKIAAALFAAALPTGCSSSGSSLYDIQTLRLSGDAALDDAREDGGQRDDVVDRVSGTFDCAINLGGGPRPAPARFSGFREL